MGIRALATAGANVTIACRDLKRAQQTAQSFKEAGLNVEAAMLDLASLHSVFKFTQQYLDDHEALDILINNVVIIAYAVDSKIMEHQRSNVRVCDG